MKNKSSTPENQAFDAVERRENFEQMSFSSGVMRTNFERPSFGSGRSEISPPQYKWLSISMPVENPNVKS